MHKEKKDKLRNYYIALSIFGLLFVGSWKVYGHFAKTSALEVVAKTMIEGQKAAAKSFAWVEERLAIGTHDDRVRRQKEAVESAKNRIRFKSNDESPTTREVEDVEIQKERLKEVIKERDELIEQYKIKD